MGRCYGDCLSLSRLPRTPRIGLRADISSGDKGGSSALGTFNPLFPAGNYFGVLADTGPGPSNFRDLHPEFILPLAHAFDIGLANIDQPLFHKSVKPGADVTSPVGYIRLHGRNYKNWFSEKADVRERYEYLYTVAE